MNENCAEWADEDGTASCSCPSTFRFEQAEDGASPASSKRNADESRQPEEESDDDDPWQPSVQGPATWRRQPVATATAEAEAEAVADAAPKHEDGLRLHLPGLESEESERAGVGLQSTQS